MAASKSFTRSFLLGFFSPLRALKFIGTSPSLFGLILIPLTINVGIYILYFYHGATFIDSYVDALHQSWAQALPPWASALGFFIKWFLKILEWLVLVLIAALTFTIISGVVCAPFNDLVSRRVSKIFRKRANKATGTSDNKSAAEPQINIIDSTKLELKRTVFLILGGVCAFFLGLIPLLQIPAMMIAAFLLSFEYFGYPISRATQRLNPVWGFTFRNFGASLGQGLFLLLVIAVPFASILYIPMAVVSGTLLYEQLEQNQ